MELAPDIDAPSAYAGALPEAPQDVSLQLLAKLSTLLEEEFELLKKATFEAIESVQARKVELLGSIQEITTFLLRSGGGTLPDSVMASAVECRNLHRRNEVLLGRRLDAVRGALRALEVSRYGEPTELYDRAGRTTWPHGKRGRRV